MAQQVRGVPVGEVVRAGGNRGSPFERPEGLQAGGEVERLQAIVQLIGGLGCCVDLDGFRTDLGKDREPLGPFRPGQQRGGSAPSSSREQESASRNGAASKAAHRRSQTPAWCQSRRRRQQVIPEPQPICGGSISQGIPVMSTKRMPVSTARSGIGGRPPFGRGLCGGSNGSIAAHSSSETICLAIRPSIATLKLFC